MKRLRDDSDPLLIPAAKACKRLSISPRMLWALTASGEIPVIRLGRLVRYRPASLDQWLKDRERGGRNHE